jgi:hypothetical protein
MLNAYLYGQSTVGERLLQGLGSLGSVEKRRFDMKRQLKELGSPLEEDGKTSMSGMKIKTVAASRQVDSDNSTA